MTLQKAAETLLNSVQANDHEGKAYRQAVRRVLSLEEVSSITYVACDAMLQLVSISQAYKPLLHILPNYALHKVADSLIQHFIAFSERFPKLECLFLCFDGYGWREGEEGGTDAKRMEHSSRYGKDSTTMQAINLDMLELEKCEDESVAEQLRKKIWEKLKTLKRVEPSFRRTLFCLLYDRLKDHEKIRMIFSNDEGEALVKRLSDFGALACSKDNDLVLMGCEKVCQVYRNSGPLGYISRADIFSETFHPVSQSEPGMFVEFSSYDNLPLIVLAVLMGTDFFSIDGSTGLKNVGPTKGVAIIRSWLNSVRALDLTNEQAFRSIIEYVTQLKEWRTAVRDKTPDEIENFVQQLENAVHMFYFCPTLEFQSRVDTTHQGLDLLRDIKNKSVMINWGHVNPPSSDFAPNVRAYPWFRERSFTVARMYGDDLTDLPEHSKAVNGKLFSGWRDAPFWKRIILLGDERFLSELAFALQIKVGETSTRPSLILHLENFYGAHRSDPTVRVADPEPFFHRFTKDPEQLLAADIVTAVRTSSSMSEGILNFAPVWNRFPRPFCFKMAFFDRCGIPESGNHKFSHTNTLRILRLVLCGHIEVEKCELFFASHVKTKRVYQVFRAETIIPSLRSQDLYMTHLAFTTEGEFDVANSGCTCKIGTTTCAHQIALCFMLGLLLQSRSALLQSKYITTDDFLAQFPEGILITQDIVQLTRNTESSQKRRSQHEQQVTPNASNYVASILGSIIDVIFHDKQFSGFPTILFRVKDKNRPRENRPLFSSESEKQCMTKATAALLWLTCQSLKLPTRT